MIVVAIATGGAAAPASSGGGSGTIGLFGCDATDPPRFSEARIHSSDIQVAGFSIVALDIEETLLQRITIVIRLKLFFQLVASPRANCLDGRRDDLTCCCMNRSD